MAPQDGFEALKASATLRHQHYKYMPIDIGVPSLDGDGADAFAAPPLDLDELAACAGQSRVFGPVVGRLIMAAGSYFALFATWAAVSALQSDKKTLRALGDKTQELKKLPQSEAISGLGRILHREMKERGQARKANWVLLPGALGMSVNLLGSAELLGHFLPALQPIAAFAMGPAAICMALYGGYIAITCLSAHRRSAQASRARQQAAKLAWMQQDTWDTAVRQNLVQEKSKRLWDAVLGASGALQAVGAITQWLLGPVWLLVLLPGTVGLVVGKILRTRALGAFTVSANVDHNALDHSLPQTAQWAQAAQLRLRRLRRSQKVLSQAEVPTEVLRAHWAQALDACGGADSARVQPLVQRLKKPPGSLQQEAQDGVSAVVALGGFEYLALEVAQSLELPPVQSAREDREAYTITGEDVVQLVTHAPQQLQPHVMQILRGVLAKVTSSYCVAIAQQQEALAIELTGQMIHPAAM